MKQKHTEWSESLVLLLGIEHQQLEEITLVATPRLVSSVPTAAARLLYGGLLVELLHVRCDLRSDMRLASAYSEHMGEEYSQHSASQRAKWTNARSPSERELRAGCGFVVEAEARCAPATSSKGRCRFEAQPRREVLERSE